MKFSRASFYVLILLLLTVVLALAACGPAPDPPTPTDTPDEPAPATQAAPEDGEAGDVVPTPGEEGYPPPAPTLAPTADGPYPPPTQPIPTPVQSYPEPAAETTPENGIAFAFERPISAGDTVIRGVGPAGIEIRLVNVTFMGEEMVTGTVDSDGRFELTVAPLEPGIRIGLTADIEGTDLEERIVPGEGALGVPQVGYFFDTVVIFAESADS